jgi:hypothetical protein
MPSIRRPTTLTAALDRCEPRMRDLVGTLIPYKSHFDVR